MPASLRFRIFVSRLLSTNLKIMLHKIIILPTVLYKKRPVGSPRHRFEHNIRMDLKEMSWKFMKWIPLTQDRDQE
jgi:hypothetical protein